MASEIYPVPMFPTLEVTDAAASAAWYGSLGFEHVFTMPGPTGQPTLVHLRWAKFADLLLRQAATPHDGTRGRGVSLTFTLTQDEVVALADRARASGARILAEPAIRPWNARDVSIVDPDGYRLVFSFGPVDVDASIEDLVERVADAHGRKASRSEV